MSDEITEAAYDGTISYISLTCTCEGQVLIRNDNTVIVCGQNSKVAIQFILSEEWHNMTCYARFKPERGSAIDVSLSSEYAVEVPHEVTDNSGTFKVSLRAENSDGRVLTSNPVEYSVTSTLSGSGLKSSQATKTIYQELFSAKENVDNALANFKTEVSSGKYGATVEVESVTTGDPGSSATVDNIGTNQNAKLRFSIPKGDKGDAATIAVGEVRTGAAGSVPSVTNVGTTHDAIFNFVIPKGDKGDAATIAVGEVRTGAAGSVPSVTNVGTTHDAIFNFVIPKGDKGDFGIGYLAPEYDEANGQYTNESIEGYFAMGRNGKEYGIRIPKTAETDCIKLGANANILVPTTSTIASPGEDPYISEGGPFRYLVSNCGVDENGVPFCTGIKGDDHFSFKPAKDQVVSAIPIFWIKIEEFETYIDLWISDTWHPGYKVFTGSVLPDGTLRPYIPIARYGLTIDSDGNARSVSGAKCTTLTVSHNSLITQCKTATTGYSGKTSMDELYVKIMFLMKYATKSSQKYFTQCSGYVYQYLLSVAETGVKRVILTNAQADTLLLNSGMQLGTNTTGANNTDRNNTLARDIFYDEQITRIETYDDGHKAVYFDNVTGTFDTTTSCLLSTSHWWTGSCDDVYGDGSPTNCTGQKEPFVIQGVEIGYGFYEILGNEIFANKDGLGWDLYVNYDSRNETTGVNDSYKQIDLNLANEGHGLYPYIDCGCSFQAQTTGGSTSTGMCDYVLVDKIGTTEEREVLSLGCLGNWDYAGLWCVIGGSRLGNAWWSIGSRLSLIGRSNG